MLGSLVFPGVPQSPNRMGWSGRPGIEIQGRILGLDWNEATQDSLACTDLDQDEWEWGWDRWGAVCERLYGCLMQVPCRLVGGGKKGGRDSEGSRDSSLLKATAHGVGLDLTWPVFPTHPTKRSRDSRAVCKLRSQYT